MCAHWHTPNWYRTDRIGVYTDYEYGIIYWSVYWSVWCYIITWCCIVCGHRVDVVLGIYFRVFLESFSSSSVGYRTLNSCQLFFVESSLTYAEFFPPDMYFYPTFVAINKNAPGPNPGVFHPQELPYIMVYRCYRRQGSPGDFRAWIHPLHRLQQYLSGATLLPNFVYVILFEGLFVRTKWSGISEPPFTTYPVLTYTDKTTGNNDKMLKNTFFEFYNTWYFFS